MAGTKILTKLLNPFGITDRLESARNVVLNDSYPCHFRLAASCDQVPFDSVLLHLEHFLFQSFVLTDHCRTGEKDDDEDVVTCLHNGERQRWIQQSISWILAEVLRVTGGHPRHPG
jgi:hypothetical protein